jgi:DNA-binding XRE family transcriptional regulator
MENQPVTSAPAHLPLLSAVRAALGAAIFHSLPVAGTLAGDPEKLPQDALAQNAGVSRSTISKYMASRLADDGTVNPDLETLCKLASALNVPPAFLLMTPADWTKLGQAAADSASWINDPEVRKIVYSVRQRRPGPVDRGKSAIDLARRLGVLPHESAKAAPRDDAFADIPDHWRQQQAELQHRSRLGVLTATALPPIGTRENSDDHLNELIALLCICTLIGAATNAI